TAEPPSRDYVFAGPEVRRMTAEQFADAIGSITGEWSVSTLGGRGAAGQDVGSGAASTNPGQGSTAGARAGGRPTTPSDPVSVGGYVREWRMTSTNLTRALGRPI